VRLLRPQTHPRNGQKSPKTEGLIAIDDASYFLSKIELTKGGAPSMPAWRQNLFIATSKLSTDSAESFCLPRTEP
jgi:KUP system potassium uptake protein